MKLNLSIAAAGLFVCGCVVSGEPASFDELLKKLESGRYAEREEATAALIAFVDSHWEKIEKASKHGDVERRNRLRTVMFEPTRRWLAAQLELATKDVIDAQESLKSETEKCKKAEQRLLDEEVKLEKKAEEAGAEYKKLPADADTTEATEKINRAHEAKEACVARQRVLKEEFDVFQKKTRLKLNRVQSIRDQVAQALEDGRPLGRTFPERWKTELLAKEIRSTAHVTFEFIDTPMDEAVKEVEQLARVDIELEGIPEGAGAPMINLRVTDMSVDLALDWITKLADVPFRYSSTEHKFILGK